MIQIYKVDNTDFSKNGDMTLFPVSAEVKVELNNVWGASLKHPIDAEGRWKYLEEDAVIKMPSFNGEQLFRIRKKYKSDSAVNCTLEPIFFDAIDDCFLEDVRPVDKNGQEALDIMLAPNAKYTASSDIRKISTAYYQDVNFMEALNGDVKQSYVKRWGGEICFDNFNVIVNERIGFNNGVELRYGKNIKKNGISEEVDTREVVTRIKPKAYNGYGMSGTGFVDSPNIEKYPTVRIRTMVFDDVKMVSDATESDYESGVIVCSTQEELDEALLIKCQEQYAAGIDKPIVTISVDMIILQNTELYKEFSQLESVSLGDTITCIHDKLQIETEARVISLTYDSLKEKVIGVVIGDYKNDYFSHVDSMVNRIEGAIREDGSVVGENVKGIIDAILAPLRLQSTAARKVEGRAFVIEDTDEQSELFGCMVLGTQGLQIATQRTADGKDWDFSTAITAKGIIADAIIAGTMLADRIKGGTLTLGGTDNGNGKILMLDGEGNEIGSWDKDGVEIITGGISGWKINKTQIFKTLDLYEDMTATGLANVADSAPVQYWVWMRRPSSASTFVFNVGYKTKANYLNGSDTVTSYFRVRTDGHLLATKGKIGRWDFTDKAFKGYTSDGSDGFAFMYNSSDDKFYLYCDGYIEASKEIQTEDMTIWGDLDVHGTKNRAVKVDENKVVRLSAYETASPYFGDIGFSVIGADGICKVEIEEIFSKTISTEGYAVFLQAEGPGEMYVCEKTVSYFKVHGTPGTSFAYEIKAKQRGYENTRLEVTR